MRSKPIDPAVLARLATIDATIDEFGRRVFPRGEGPRGAVELWDRTRFRVNRLARELRGAPHLRAASANAEPVMLSPELDASAFVETLAAGLESVDHDLSAVPKKITEQAFAATAAARALAEALRRAEGRGWASPHKARPAPSPDAGDGCP
jgi:hypothetical protein